MAPTDNGKTVLLAEDEETLRTLFLSMLQENGYKVIVAVDGRDALKKSRRFKGVIHLMLSSVEMPNMTGIELATRLQVIRPDIRVLLMSSTSVRVSLFNESWQFLLKPFIINLLKDRVGDLLGDARMEHWQVAAASSGD